MTMKGEINQEAIVSFLKLFGENVKKIRLQKNMTATELANKCGASIRKISRTEKGEYNFKISSILVLAKGLDVHINELLDFEGAERLKNIIWVD